MGAADGVLHRGRTRQRADDEHDRTRAQCTGAAADDRGDERGAAAGSSVARTWSGDFGHAFRLVAKSADGLVSADRRALRWAEIALFAAASGALPEAREAAAAAQHEMDAGHAGKYAALGAMYLLVALSLLGEGMTRLTLHDALLAGKSGTAGRFFIDAAETLHKHWHEKPDHHAVLAVFSALRERGFGGIAAMLESLPRQSVNTLQTFP